MSYNAIQYNITLYDIKLSSRNIILYNTTRWNITLHDIKLPSYTIIS